MRLLYHYAFERIVRFFIAHFATQQHMHLMRISLDPRSKNVAESISASGHSDVHSIYAFGKRRWDISRGGFSTPSCHSIRRCGSERIRRAYQPYYYSRYAGRLDFYKEQECASAPDRPATRSRR